VNLRKDHCRNLPSRTTRELVLSSGGSTGARASWSPSAVGSMALALGPSAQQRTPARTAPRKLNKRACPCRPGNGVCACSIAFFHYLKRLSATDISALASMKNVAKCDTWCELQNPVNHRVFERKLRPKPLGRGHACLGVTHRCPRQTLVLGRDGWTWPWADIGLPCAERPAVGLNTSRRRWTQ
jgi:hypothetical protein